MSSQRRTGHRGAMDTRVQVGGADAAAKQAALQRLLVDRFAAKLGANSHEMRAIDSEVGAYLKLATVVDREGYEEIKGRVRAVLGVRGSGGRHASSESASVAGGRGRDASGVRRTGAATGSGGRGGVATTTDRRVRLAGATPRPLVAHRSRSHASIVVGGGSGARQGRTLPAAPSPLIRNQAGPSALAADADRLSVSGLTSVISLRHGASRSDRRRPATQGSRRRGTPLAAMSAGAHSKSSHDLRQRVPDADGEGDRRSRRQRRRARDLDDGPGGGGRAGHGGAADRHRDDRGRGERARASTAMPSSRGRGARAGSTVSKASVDEWLLLRELDLLEREFVEKQRKEKELEATRQHFEEIDRQNDMIRTIKVDEEVAEVRFAEEAERRRREEGRLSRAVAAAKKADNAAFFESQKEQILERTLARTNARELRLAAEAGEVENIQQQIDLEKVYAAKRDKKVKRANRIVQRTNQKLVKEQEAVKEAERRAHKASAEVERIALEKQEMARRAALEKNYGKFKAQDLALELTQQLEEHHAEQRRRERELREDDERAAARLREEGRAIRAKAAADKAALEATWADIRRTTEEQKWQREADARAEAADGERHKRALQQQLALEKQAAERRRRDRLQFDEQYRAGLAVQIKAVRDKPDAGAMTDKERRLNAQRLKEIRSNPALKKVIKMRLRVPVES